MPLDSMKNKILDIVGPLGHVFPEYHPDAADINEALDHGVASCAVRAYASALLIRDAYPNSRLYNVGFGFDQAHGGDYKGENGTYLKMGHAVTRLWIPELPPLVVESYADVKLEVIPQRETHDSFSWHDPDEGYKLYLEQSDVTDVDIDPVEILRFLQAKMSD